MMSFFNLFQFLNPQTWKDNSGEKKGEMRSWKKSKQPNFLYEHCPRWERMREAGGDGTFIDLSSDEVTLGLWSFYFDPVIYCLKKMFSQIHLDKVGSRVSPFLKVFLSVLFLDLQGESWSQNALMRLGKPYYYYYTLLYTRTSDIKALLHGINPGYNFSGPVVILLLPQSFTFLSEYNRWTPKAA